MNAQAQLRRAYGDRYPGSARRWQENVRPAMEALAWAPARRRAAFALRCRVHETPPLDATFYEADGAEGAAA